MGDRHIYILRSLFRVRTISTLCGSKHLIVVGKFDGKKFLCYKY